MDPIEYEPHVQKRFDECMIIHQIFYYMTPTAYMSEYKEKAGIRQLKEIKERAQRLADVDENYIQWLYDAFMKRKDHEVFFFNQTEESEASSKAEFIKQLLHLGAKH